MSYFGFNKNMKNCVNTYNKNHCHNMYIVFYLLLLKKVAYSNLLLFKKL